MRLVADLDKIKSNIDSLSLGLDDFTSSLSTFNGTSINCTLTEISSVLESFKSSISDDLDKLNTSSHEYESLVRECCSEYQNNEENNQSIDISIIESIISNNPDITTNYDMKNAKEKLSTIPEAIFGPALKDTGNPKVDNVYNTLAKKGFNSAAICGILANIEHESGFNTTAVGDGGTSYGLCQWHNGRWDSLNNFCANNGYDPSSLEGQLEYLCYELENKYPGVYEKLQNVPDTPEGAYEAAYEWTVHFEVPSYRDSKGRSRGETAKTKYWETYGT